MDNKYIDDCILGGIYGLAIVTFLFFILALAYKDYHYTIATFSNLLIIAGLVMALIARN